MDCVHLRPEGVAGQIWRGCTKSQLPPMTPELTAQIVEVESGTVNEGDLFDEAVKRFAPPPIDLVAYAAARRFRAEIGGILVAGVVVSTEPEAQRKISELRRRVEAGEIPVPFAFKAVNGWAELDAGQIIALDRAVAAHIARCFACEFGLVARIANQEITTAAQIDAAFEAIAE